jgi:hypothetical protein
MEVNNITSITNLNNWVVYFIQDNLFLFGVHYALGHRAPLIRK